MVLVNVWANLYLSGAATAKVRRIKFLVFHFTTNLNTAFQIIGAPSWSNPNTFRNIQSKIMTCWGSSYNRGRCLNNKLLLYRAALTGLAVLLVNEKEKLSYGVWPSVLWREETAEPVAVIISTTPHCSWGSLPSLQWKKNWDLMKDVMEQQGP